VALVTVIERIAREPGLTMLELESSVNAEPFYAALGGLCGGFAANTYFPDSRREDAEGITR
jgi:hypothetical protein